MSALGEHLARYLALRLALGYGPSYDRWLTRFVAHLDIAGLTTVTADSAVEWAEHDASTRAAAACRLVAVRGFASYLKAFDPATQVPEVYSGGKGRPVAHIYTSAEVEALLAAAAGLRPELWGQTMATLIGLLAATGIRPGEAYRLRSHDVDLVERRLRLIDSKFGRSREIPVDQSTVDALARYRELRDKAFPQPSTGPFLVTATGRNVTSATAAAAFRGLRRQAGINTASGRPAQLGDLRHSFAVATLLDWHRQRLDVQPRLPMFSAYLGHVNPASTYWYLRATPELLAVAAQRLQPDGEVSS